MPNRFASRSVRVAETGGAGPRRASCGAEAPSRSGRAVIWVHGPDATELAATAALAHRMAADDEEIAWVVTGGGGPLPEPLVAAQLSDDAMQGLRPFLDRWRPDLLVWMRGNLRRRVLAEAEARGITRLLVDADASALPVPRRLRWPGVRPAAPRLDRAIAVDEEGAARLRRLGVPPSRIEVLGRFDEAALTLPVNEDERARLSSALRGRPVWFAPDVTERETPLLAAAHRQASRRSHRLLLAVAGRDSGAQGRIAAQFAADGFEVTTPDAGPPEEAQQIVVLQGQQSRGLWYRLAQVSFLGGTLTGPSGPHPFEAAALGSAILYGPHTEPWTSAYQRLAQVGAGRCVRDAGDLGAQVESLLAPDRAAAMAHAGWETISANAAVTNRLREIVIETLDAAGH